MTTVSPKSLATLTGTTSPCHYPGLNERRLRSPQRELIDAFGKVVASLHACLTVWQAVWLITVRSASSAQSVAAAMDYAREGSSAVQVGHLLCRSVICCAGWSSRVSGLSLEFKNFESTMSGSTDILLAGGAPTDSELMQMMSQQQGQQQEILLRLQAMEDARASAASARGAPLAGVTVPARTTAHELASW
jgi:hypothetical protein